ncbi:MAG: TolC family protein, partial [Candidatus Heimdallarchaeaceae archaeon]
MTQRKYIISLTILIMSNIQLLFSQNIMENEIVIDSCIQLALLNNYEFKVYQQDKKIALKQFSIQQSKLLPTINFSSEYMFTDQFDDLETYNAGNASIQVYQP